MKTLFFSIWAVLLILSTDVAALKYDLIVDQFSPLPVLSYVDGSAAFEQVFNPSYFPPSPGTGGVEGLLIRTQNCSAKVGGPCVQCGGSPSTASILTYARLLNGAPLPVLASSVVFSPDPNEPLEAYGTEDPRVAYDNTTGIYYMFYTCYGHAAGQQASSVLLCLATTRNPTCPDGWTRHGPVFPREQNSKSAALLLRDHGPHYLFWGAGEIRVTTSNDPATWANIGDVLIAPRKTMFDSAGVESGPPPLRLASGDYLFIYNSWDLGWPHSQDPSSGYHPAYVILNGSNPSQILQRADTPFLLPATAWEQGVYPYSCNVARVVFVEAAIPLGGDRFRIFFGGSDAVIGSAIIRITTTAD
eukprot:m.237841 g.237841  ORF g.237841 m.237841 type:complete len:359 (-) comp21437_c0_seq1:27-1103(-)